MQYTKLKYLWLFFLVFTPAGAFGQSSLDPPGSTKSVIQESILSITVRDQFDGIITSAQIILTKAGSGDKIQIQTDDSGMARIRSLAAGDYQITVSAAGFKEYQSEKIRLENRSRLRLDVVLEIASIESNIIVSESEAVDSERSTPAVVIDQKNLNNLPENQKDFERALRNLAGADPEEEIPISVNGVQGAKIPPKGAIQQVRINQNVYSAQFDSPSGSGADIFTRATADKFSGSIGLNFAGSRFDAGNPFLGTAAAPYRSGEYSFNLSGPLGKKSGFFINASRHENDRSAVISASVLDADLQPAAFRQSNAAPFRANDIYLNFNSDLAKKHKIFLSAAIYNNRSRSDGTGDFTLPERAAETSNGGGNVQFSDTFLKNANVVNQTAISFFSFISRSRPAAAAVALDVSEAFSSGGSTQNFKNKISFFQASNQTTRQMNKFALAFGGRVRANFIDQNSLTNFNGSYLFSGRLAPILDAANMPVTDASGNYLTAQITSLESYRRTLLFRRLGFSGQKIRELGGGAAQFTIAGGNPFTIASQYDYALYLQNSYRLTPTVAVSFGLRYENQNNLKNNSNFAPRVGIIWAPKGPAQGKFHFSPPRISAGFGVFYARSPLSNTLNVRLSDDADKVQYLITDAATLDFFPVVQSVASLQQTASPKTRRFIDDQLKTPLQAQLTMSITEKLAGGFSLNLALTTGTTFRQNVFRNVNAPPAGTYDPLDPQSSVRPFPEAGNIYGMFSNGTSKKTKFSAQLQFPNAGKLYAYVSYYFIRSKNDVVNGSSAPFDPYNFSGESAPGTADGIQSVNGYSSYQLPHGFSAGASYTFRTGGRFNIFTGRDTNGDGFFNERPALASDVAKPGLIQTKYGLLDPNPAAGAILIPRNLGRGSGYFSFDANLSKTFNFGDEKSSKNPARRSLKLSLDIYNLFNTINRSDPVGNMSSPYFLQVTKGASDNDSGTANEGYYSSYGSGENSNAVGRHFSFGISYKF